MFCSLLYFLSWCVFFLEIKDGTHATQLFRRRNCILKHHVTVFLECKNYRPADCIVVGLILYSGGTLGQIFVIFVPDWLN